MNKVEKFLSDMSYNSTFRFLDMGSDKDKKKLLEVAKSNNLVLPAQDLSVFECVYAFTDRENKNGCTLPRNEVEKALKTLRGKSIDLDHMRKSVVGHWIDAKLDGDTIIAYGAIFKGSFQEDYDVIQELFNKGNLAVSFEAWGKRIPNGTVDGGYDLTNIEFAGGALLLRSEPAFDGAGVLEMAKDRVLEMAKVMTAPKTFAHEVDEDLEKARMYVSDMDGIMRSLSQIDCPSCKEQHCMDPMMIDYANNKMKAQCYNCSAEMMVDMTPPTTLTKKGRKINKISDIKYASISSFDEFLKDTDISDERFEVSIEESLKPFPRINLATRFELADDDFAIVKNIEIAKDKVRKIRIIPIHDLAHINLARTVLNTATAKELLEKLSLSQDNVDRKILRKVLSISMKDLMEKYKKANAHEVIQEVAKSFLKRELTKEELEKAYSLFELKATKPAGSDNSLNEIPKGKIDANSTSLQSAKVTEEELQAIISEATKAPEVKKEVPVTEDAKVTELQKKLDEANAKLTEATAKIDAFVKAQEDAKIAEEANKKAELVKARRDELGDIAKDMKDEDLLDETKFVLAKKDKEIAELKKGTKTTTTVVDLSKGSKDKTTLTPEQASREKVGKIAFDKRYRKSQASNSESTEVEE